MLFRSITEEQFIKDQASIAINRQKITYAAELLSIEQKRVEEIASADAKIAVAKASTSQVAITEAETAKDSTLASLDAQVLKLGILNTTKLRSIQQDTQWNALLASQTDQMTKMVDITTSLGNVFGTLGDSIGKAGEAILKMAENDKKNSLAKLDLVNKTADAKSNMSDDPEAYAKALKEEAALDKNHTNSKLSDIANVAGATKKMFAEHTFAYKALAGVEKVVHIVKLGMMAAELVADLTGTTASVANSATRTGASVVEAGVDGVKAVVKAISSMPFPLNFIAGGLTAAAVGGLLASIGGSSPEVPATPGGISAADQQKTQGTGQTWSNGQIADTSGGVFGDNTAKNDAIVKSLEILNTTGIEGLDYNKKMLKAMEKVALAVTSVATSVYQIPGIRVGSGFGTAEGTSGGSFLGWGSSTTTSIQDAGVVISGAFSDLADASKSAVKQYETVLKVTESSSWFGLSHDSNSSVNTTFKPLEDPKLKQAFADIFSNATNMFVEVGKSAGITKDTIESTLKTIPITLTTSLKGLTGPQMEAELNATVGKALSTASETLFAGMFEQYNKFGEDYLTTVIRVVDGNNKLNQALLSMGDSFSIISKFNISEDMIKAAGSLQTFMDQASFFKDNFLSEAEKLAPVQKGVTDQLAKLHISTTITRDEYKKLVLAQDLGTVAGQQMYQSLMELAPGFDTVAKAAETAASNLLSIQKEISTQEIKLYELLGNSSEALAMTRANELDAMDALLRPRQNYINALTDEIAIRDKLKTAYTSSNNSLLSSIKTLTDYKTALAAGASSTLSPAEKYAQAKAMLLQTAAAAQATITATSSAADIATRATAISKLQPTSETFLATSKEVNASGAQY